MWFSVGTPNFIQIGQPASELWRLSDFQDGGNSVENLLPVSKFGDISQLETSKSICTLNFDNVAQSLAEILLLPVSENQRPPYRNSTSGFHFDVFIVIAMWFCVAIPNFVQTGPSAGEIWHHSDFQDGYRQPCWICHRALVDHPRNVVDGCCYVLKFWLDRIYCSFEGSAIIVNFAFWLEFAYSPPLLGDFGSMFLQNDVTYRPTHKRHLLARKHVVWAIKRENRSSGSTCAQDREKRTGQDSQKSHKGVILHL